MKRILAAVIATALILVGVAPSAAQPAEQNEGDVRIVVQQWQNGRWVDIDVQAYVPAWSPAPTETPAPTLAPPTASPLPPTPEPTLAPTAPPPTASPTPQPSPPPPTATIGFGAGATGGAGGAEFVVSNANDFETAVKASGPRIVRIDVSGPETWGPLGKVSITDGDLTIIGHPDVVFRGSWLHLKSVSNVIIDGVNIGQGDQGVSAGDAEPITLNGNRAPVRDIVIRNSTLAWGPDIGGLAILGDVARVTVQDSIVCCGLYLSDHPEGTAAENGHSYSLNMSSDPGVGTKDVTVARSFIGRSDGRNPKVTGGNGVELVNNLFSGWDQRPPEGVGEAIHVVANAYRPFPGDQMNAWEPRLNNQWGYFGNAIWLDGNELVDGTPFDSGADPQSEYASGPLFASPTPVMPASDVEAFVLANAGDGGAFAQRFLDDYLAGINTRFNGVGNPPPNPEW